MTTFVKQPAEQLRHRFTFPEPVTDLAAPISAVPRGLVTGAAVLAIGAVTFGLSGVDVAIGGGSDGERYLVTVRASSAGTGNVHEAELEVAVVDGQWTMPDGGTPYLSIADFVAQFGLAEVLRMTDAGDGRIDRELLVQALQAAQAQADINLAARYAVPLAEVPVAIRTAIADIARARLYPGGAPEGIATAARDAARMLDRIASGALPLPLPAGGTAAAAPSEAPIVSHSGGRAYPDGLAGYGREDWR